MSKRRKNPFPTWEEMLALEAKYGVTIGSRLSLPRPLSKGTTVPAQLAVKSPKVRLAKTVN